MKLLTTSFLIMMVSLLTAQDSPWYPVDQSPLDGAYYPSNSAWRNYLSGDDRNKAMQIKVLYSRPQKKGREIFGGLLSYGKEWRLGANEASTITFRNAVDFAGTTVYRGTYSMLAEVHADHWIIKLSSELGLWGTANRDMDKTVAEVKVPVQIVDDELEALTITFRKMDDLTAHMVIQWDKTQVAVPIGFNPIMFDDLDISPMEVVTYPSKATGVNYLKAEEKNIKPTIQVTYGRPYKKGRDVFGGLLPYGKLWRVGANESTEITFYTDVTIGGTDVKKGTYGLYATVHEDRWDFILSTDIPSWGYTNRDETKDIATFSASTQQIKQEVENLTIYFDEKKDSLVHMVIGWDRTMVEVPITY